jgi:uncharacterized lipoprotein YddW (UPF0748 family)
MRCASRQSAAALCGVLLGWAAGRCGLAAAEGADAEFRGAWLATVANIDWPSRPGLPSLQQQSELRALFDTARDLGLNAIVFQVRPAADALYASSLEPWSEYLTGAMGRPPTPFYDPLEFAVAEAHARGLQLHAWFNPYRVRHATAEGEAAANHASRAMPEAVRTYGKYLWFDPGEPAAVERTLAVMLDVVRRYDVDGVHIDDYFYPYPIKDAEGRRVEFPDDASYARAVAAGETLGRDDWRRQNVDRFVERMYRSVKEAKPRVLVGISPFGIWRPGHPEGVQGFDQHAELYADARRWLREGWVDYFSPQLYWKIDSPGQSFPRLLAWWDEQNVRGRRVWPGLYTSQVGNRELNDWPAEEIVRQIGVVRGRPGDVGHIHFSLKALHQNYGGIADALRDGPYARRAALPAAAP